MTIEQAIKNYKDLSQPPKSALRTITEGRLKGKTDINPQWRYEAMTQKYGLVGFGWKYEVQKLWTEPGAGAEKIAFAQVAVYIRDGDQWSDAIIGIGGNKLVAQESKGAHTNDEGYKMAVTDAFSTSLKMLGVAADVYAGRWDGSKYKPQEKPAVKLAGGDSTPAQKQRIQALLETKRADGSPLYTTDEKRNYCNMRQTKTAAELIALLENENTKRMAPAPVQQVAEAFDGTVEQEPQQDIF